MVNVKQGVFMKTRVIPTLTIGDYNWYLKIFNLYRNLNISYIRINLTRFTYDEYINEIMIIKKIQEDIWGKEVFKIILDVPYPGVKARVSFNGDKNYFDVKIGDTIYIHKNKKDENFREKRLSTNLFSSLSNGKIGDYIEIDDGKILFKIVEKKDDFIKLESLSKGSIGYMKTVNIKGKVYSNEVRQSEKEDLRKLIFAIKPYKIMFSFINDTEDIIYIKNFFKIQTDMIIPKIETPVAMSNLENISNYCSQVMLGRGDLALTGKPSLLGIYQENFINTCKKNKAEIIIATDIMTSNIETKQSLPLRSDLIDLDLLIKKEVNFVVTSGKMGLGEKLNEFVDIITAIEKERFL